jgi:uncharacterized coiled-coil DUF342 family protein
MIRRRRKDQGVTPSQAADIAAAREARERIERTMQTSRLRWPRVRAIAARLEEIREENHLAEDLHVIFSERRG